MKYAIGRLDRNLDNAINRPSAVLPEACFYIGNPSSIPPIQEDVNPDHEYHLFQYDPQDQFAYIVSLDLVGNAIAAYLSQPHKPRS